MFREELPARSLTLTPATTSRQNAGSTGICVFSLRPICDTTGVIPLIDPCIGIMRLRPIDDSSSGDAPAVLKREFPEKTESFRGDGLRKILSSPSRRDAQPVGFPMTTGGKDVGIVLTIPSEQPGPDGKRNVVNPAAWCVDEPHRWLAPRMLQKVVAQEAAVTDLTPSPAAQRINQRLGFEILNEGFQIFPLPVDRAWSAQGSARNSP
jgi:hypothetical protein